MKIEIFEIHFNFIGSALDRAHSFDSETLDFDFNFKCNRPLRGQEGIATWAVIVITSMHEAPFVEHSRKHTIDVHAPGRGRIRRAHRSRLSTCPVRSRWKKTLSATWTRLTTYPCCRQQKEIVDRTEADYRCAHSAVRKNRLTFHP